MSILVKRRRGRPRLHESKVIKNFDSALIEEVKKFPVLYDRENPNYRNKAEANRYWRRVAIKLNTSESVVKNRLFQLRNRYNVEKRRMELNPESYDGESNWPLYKNISFLVEFGQARHRHLMSQTAAVSSSEEDCNADDEEKNECYTNDLHLIQNSEKPKDADIVNQLQYNDNNCIDREELYNKKFRAFGEFLASSLIEMSEMQALHLVKKFTTDLVEYSKLGDINKLNKNVHHLNNGDECLLD
ncbi:uncharacterized protein LOC133335279 [Musca vetustissima]|uniref:uncharacterized protein LOC133335279 n=1 Tax=Musca vetustissima TaxID=27455 RepID=UPI002AB7223D|nr:uncharacterized protein LOC133335279 [Musca vetustissima]